MQLLKFINARGEEAVFDLAPPFIFWKISGLSLPPVDVHSTQAPGQHGYTLHSILFDSRIVTLTGHVHGVNHGEDSIRKMYEERHKLNRICNPLIGQGKLVYENDSGAWQISAFCNQMPYESKMKSIQTLNLSFECPSPFWLSVEASKILLAYVEGGLQFPIVTPNQLGTLGYRSQIDNDSDDLVPLVFDIEGGSKNPIITNTTTGEFIKLGRQLKESDRLYINTDPEHIEVSLLTIDPITNKQVKENAYGYLTVDSKLFGLVPGDNELIFKSDDENKKVKIKITFHKRFGGV